MSSNLGAERERENNTTTSQQSSQSRAVGHILQSQQYIGAYQHQNLKYTKSFIYENQYKGKIKIYHFKI